MKKIFYSSTKNKITSFEPFQKVITSLEKEARIIWIYLFHSHPKELKEKIIHEEAYFIGFRELVSKKYLVPLGPEEWLFVPFPNSTN